MGDTKPPTSGGAVSGNPGGGDQPKLKSAQVVQYVGTADVRIIDKAGWTNADVNDQNKVVWDAKNKWTVSVEDLSDDAVAYLDQVDDGFVLKAVEV